MYPDVALLCPVVSIDTVNVTTRTMGKASRKVPEGPKLRGLRCRQTYKAEKMKRPIAWIEHVYPDLTDAEKTSIRMFLLGRAPENMPEELMLKAETALQRLIAA